MKEIDAKSLQPAIIVSKDQECQKNLQKIISSLINAYSLKISSDVFSKEPYLYLTNHKRDDFLSKTSMLENDLGGRKTLFLYKEYGNYYIGVLNRDKKVIKKEKLSDCKAQIILKK